jgi:hypothetical protein
MNIKFYQSGGLAGLTLSCEIDTRSLPQAEAAKIENLVRICGVLKRKIKLSRIRACDSFGYSISVESNEISYRVSFDDFTIPEGSLPLLNYLKKHARPHEL